MSSSRWDDISDYIEGSRRHVGALVSMRSRGEAEVFTPTGLVVEILQTIDVALFAPGQRILDPACGDGQFLVAAKAVKILVFGLPEDEALQEIFGVDIVRENVDACLARLSGGNIYMGDTLNPNIRLVGQTNAEWLAVQKLFPTSMKKRSKVRTRIKAQNGPITHNAAQQAFRL